MPNKYDQQRQILERRRQIAEALRASGNEALPSSLDSGRIHASVSGWQHANKALEKMLGAYYERTADKDEKRLEKEQAAAQADWMRGLSEAQAPSELQPQAPTGDLMMADNAPISALELNPNALPGATAPVGLQEQMARRMKGQALRGDVQNVVDAGDQQKLMAHAMRGQEVGGAPEAIGGELMSRSLFPPAKKIDRVDLGDRIGVYEDGKLTGYEKKGASPDAAATLAASTNNRLADRNAADTRHQETLDQARELARLQRATTERGQDAVTDRAAAARTNKGQEAVDKKFGAEYAEYVSGGAATQQTAIDELKVQSEALKTTQASGPVIGALPDFARKRDWLGGSGAGFDIQQNIERNIQASLRETLGAQYTQKEGENLLARTFDPSLKESINKTRLDSLITKLERAKQEKDRAAEYFKTNGTLAGFEGKTSWATTDFEPDDDAPAAAAPAGNKLKKNADGSFDYVGRP